jgi:hypothetical protein
VGPELMLAVIDRDHHRDTWNDHETSRRNRARLWVGPERI